MKISLAIIILFAVLLSGCAWFQENDPLTKAAHIAGCTAIAAECGVDLQNTRGEVQPTFEVLVKCFEDLNAVDCLDLAVDEEN